MRLLGCAYCPIGKGDDMMLLSSREYIHQDALTSAQMCVCVSLRVLMLNSVCVYLIIHIHVYI